MGLCLLPNNLRENRHLPITFRLLAYAADCSKLGKDWSLRSKLIPFVLEDVLVIFHTLQSSFRKTQYFCCKLSMYIFAPGLSAICWIGEQEYPWVVCQYFGNSLYQYLRQNQGTQTHVDSWSGSDTVVVWEISARDRHLLVLQDYLVEVLKVMKHGGLRSY